MGVRDGKNHKKVRMALPSLRKKRKKNPSRREEQSHQSGRKKDDLPDLRTGGTRQILRKNKKGGKPPKNKGSLNHDSLA